MKFKAQPHYSFGSDLVHHSNGLLYAFSQAKLGGERKLVPGKFFTVRTYVLDELQVWDGGTQGRQAVVQTCSWLCSFLDIMWKWKGLSCAGIPGLGQLR